MAKVSTNISIDPKLKEESISLFSEFGLDLSTAISLFLNATTKAALAEFEEMKKNKEKYKRHASFAEILEEV